MNNLDPEVAKALDLEEVEEEDAPQDEEVIEEINEAEGDEEGTEDEGGQEEPSELDQLRADVASLRAERAHIDDLRRSVGRIQALESQLETAKQTDLETREQLVSEIEDNFGGVTELLETVVNGIDETSIDPATRARAQAVLNDRKRAAELASLKKTVTAEVRQELQPAQPQQVQPQQTSPFTQQELVNYSRLMEDRLTAGGVNPDNVDWTSATRELVEKGLDGLISFVDGEIERSSAAKTRQASKKSAGSGSPSTGAATPDPGDVSTGIDYKDVDDGIAKLRALGISI
jgi:hypothetical protein